MCSLGLVMVERKVVEGVRDKAASGVRSPLLMPIMEGNTLESDHVAEFLKGRLSHLHEKSAPRPRIRLS